MSFRRAVWAGVVASAVIGCGEQTTLDPYDIGGPDAGPVTFRPDAARMDAAVDAGGASDLGPDAGDGGSGDAGEGDAGEEDAGDPDAAVPDAMIPDVEIPDVEIPDVEIPDMEIPDADLPDADRPDAFLGEALCADDVDNDEDGATDCEDSDCRGTGPCFDAREICDDNRDNNGDGIIDCDDVYCHDEPGCPRPDVPAYSTAEVDALFAARCGPCHTSDEQVEAMLDLNPPAAERLINAPSNQVPNFFVLIRPGDRLGSYIYQKMRYRQNDLEIMGAGQGMPPDRPLTSTEVERFGRWIDGLPGGN